MKFLCIGCDEVMGFAERQLPGDGTMAAVFTCPGCGHEMAMLTNPMETQLVSSLGVRVGGRTVPEQPMELTRTGVTDGREHAFAEAAVADAPAEDRGGAGVDPAATGSGPEDRDRSAVSQPPAPQARVTWDDEAVERLSRVPSFVRGMVKRIYADWAMDNGVAVITTELMDRARSELGLEGM
jgi:Proto-chlorophyllide reductase 57 kD subunit